VRAEELLLQLAVGHAGHIQVERALEQRDGGGRGLVVRLARFVRFEVAQRDEPRVQLEHRGVAVALAQRGVFGYAHLLRGRGRGRLRLRGGGQRRRRLRRRRGRGGVRGLIGGRLLCVGRAQA